MGNRDVSTPLSGDKPADVTVIIFSEIPVMKFKCWAKTLQTSRHLAEAHSTGKPK